MRLFDLQTICLDIESSWSRKDGLGFGSQTGEEYVRDKKRFRVHGLSWKIVGSEQIPAWVRHRDLPAFFAGIDWSKIAVVCHNSAFDLAALAWVYGVHPAGIGDTLSMGRALHGVEVGNSLKALAERYNLPPKGQGLASSEGYFDELPWAVEQELAEYCRHDTWLCEQLFLRMIPHFPVSEQRLIDLTVRMYTRPLLELDAALLGEALAEETAALNKALEMAGVPLAELASNDKFALALRRVGVEPPTKISKTTGETAFAFAKNDALFQALMNSDDERAALLCEARLKAKSTQLRTRSQRFLDIASRGALPVPLNYYGAATGRWQAAKGALNLQNMKRGGVLRDSIMAPEGYVCVVSDLSQIEARVLAWFADYDYLLGVFRSGGDPYAMFGAQMFGIPGLNKTDHPLLRQVSKSAALGCGFGLGTFGLAAQLLTGFMGAAPKCYTKAEAKALGVTAAHIEKFLSWDVNMKNMGEVAHTCTEEELLIHCVASKQIIDLYRAAAAPVVKFWGFLSDMIEQCLFGGIEATYKCLRFCKEEVELPNGMKLRYPNLTRECDERGRWQYTYEVRPGKREKLYSGRLTNNIVQAVARIVLSDGMLRISERLPVVLQVHDEAVSLAPERHAQKALDWMLAQMTIEPPYMPGIPLAADGGFHRRYGRAKS